MIGRTLNHYEVKSKLGEGGMGEVYRAIDTSLGREVAIKVLSRSLSQDDEQLHRLRREARVLASLNHPNIATVYGLEECDGQTFVAMELVAGRTLQEMLASGRRMDPDRAFALAFMLADALEAAHDRGIIHRDLKPANIKVTQDGTLKVLDFGLAASVAAPIEDAATITARMTPAGTVLGTPGYMSPEQVQGERADQRSDIWAFGCILYELFTGKRAFGGRSMVEVLTATLTSEPDWTVLGQQDGRAIRKVVQRCLRKDPKRRYHHVADARLDLAERQEPETGNAAVWTGRRLALLSLAVVLAVAAASWYLFRSGPASAPAWTAEMLGGPAYAIGPRVSPDGQTVAFQTWVKGQNQVAVLNPSSGYWNVLTNQQNAGSIMDISWSADGARIFFDRFGTGIYSIPREGGEPRRILDRGLGPQTVADGSLLVTIVNDQRQNQLHRFWPDRQRLEALPVLLPPTAEAWAPPVRVFPDGKEAVFFGRLLSEPDVANRLYAIDLASKSARRLAPALNIRPTTEYFAMSVNSAGDGVLVDSPEGDLHRVIEAPRNGSDRTRLVLSLTTALWFIDAAKDGSIYADQISRPSEILKFDSSGGRPQRLGITPSFVNYFRGGILSLPDGRVLVSSVAGNRSRLLVSTPDGRLLPFVDTGDQTSGPVAVLRERQVAFLQGSGSDRRISIAAIPEDRIVHSVSSPAGEVTAMAASPDGSLLYCIVSREIWVVPVRHGGSAEWRKLAPGDGIAVDPANGDLIVQVFAGDGSYDLFRRSPEGVLKGPVQFARGTFVTYPVPLSPAAVAPDGRIVVHGGTMDTWNFRIGVIDPKRQTLQVVPLEFEGDPALPGWTKDGQIVSLGLLYRQNLWRFRPGARQ